MAFRVLGSGFIGFRGVGFDRVLVRFLYPSLMGPHVLLS